MTLFYEASTRTRISFEEAGKVLSAEVINMSGFGSSVEKGESLLNTALTLQAMGGQYRCHAPPPLRRAQLRGPLAAERQHHQRG